MGRFVEQNSQDIDLCIYRNLGVQNLLFLIARQSSDTQKRWKDGVKIIGKMFLKYHPQHKFQLKS